MLLGRLYLKIPMGSGDELSYVVCVYHDGQALWCAQSSYDSLMARGAFSVNTSRLLERETEESFIQTTVPAGIVQYLQSELTNTSNVTTSLATELTQQLMPIFWDEVYPYTSGLFLPAENS